MAIDSKLTPVFVALQQQQVVEESWYQQANDTIKYVDIFLRRCKSGPLFFTSTPRLDWVNKQTLIVGLDFLANHRESGGLMSGMIDLITMPNTARIDILISTSGTKFKHQFMPIFGQIGAPAATAASIINILRQSHPVIAEQFKLFESGVSYPKL